MPQLNGRIQDAKDVQLYTQTLVPNENFTRQPRHVQVQVQDSNALRVLTPFGVRIDGQASSSCAYDGRMCPHDRHADGVPPGSSRPTMTQVSIGIDIIYLPSILFENSATSWVAEYLFCILILS